MKKSVAITAIVAALILPTPISSADSGYTMLCVPGNPPVAVAIEDGDPVPPVSEPFPNSAVGCGAYEHLWTTSKDNQWKTISGLRVEVANQRKQIDDLNAKIERKNARIARLRDRLRNQR